MSISNLDNCVQKNSLNKEDITLLRQLLPKCSTDTLSQYITYTLIYLKFVTELLHLINSIHVLLCTIRKLMEIENPNKPILLMSNSTFELKPLLPQKPVEKLVKQQKLRSLKDIQYIGTHRKLLKYNNPQESFYAIATKLLYIHLNRFMDSSYLLLSLHENDFLPARNKHVQIFTEHCFQTKEIFIELLQLLPPKDTYNDNNNNNNLNK